MRFSTAFPIKVNSQAVRTDFDALEEIMPKRIQPLLPEDNPVKGVVPHCYYPTLEPPKVEGKTCRANRFNIRHSVHKLAIAGRVVKGMHLYDA